MKSKEEIRNWLIQQMSGLLNVEPDDVETEIPFDRYGLESADAVGLTAELEDWMGCKIDDPTLLYEYPTIEILSEHLAEQYAV